MHCVVTDSDGRVYGDMREPVCGVHVCALCGKCLGCYGEVPCNAALDGEHVWEVEEKEATE
ncbi:MAG: hypothetical protein GY832_21925 [Chloroflexi bacterium]|nr:hypothetical protein [Chloroflexota bacterium]